MAEYIKAQDLSILAAQVIKEHKELEYINNAAVEYLWSDQAKKSKHKITYADCTKVSELYRYLTGIDFIIKFYMPNTEDMTPEQLKTLMWHELKHIGYEDEEFFLNPHDVEDFEDIIKAAGLHWNEVIIDG